MLAASRCQLLVGRFAATLPVRAWGRVDWSTTKRIKFGIGSKGITVRHHEDFDVMARVIKTTCSSGKLVHLT